MTRTTLLFTVTQPSDNIKYEHMIKFIAGDVYGYENLRNVISDISIPELIQKINRDPLLEGRHGPYEWKWVS
jgi:hypothetical protein